MFSLVLTADPGDFSGTPEAHFITENLKRKRIKSRSTTVCGSIVQGTLMGQPVVVGTTGIGPSAASLCTLELLTTCGHRIKDLIYFGTSGWSAQLGGVLNPPDCGEANGNKKITRIGDVCISPFSVNWTCKKATWNMQAQGYPDQCFRPAEVVGPAANDLFGECVFFRDNMDANLRLADELVGAARAAADEGRFPLRNRNVSQHEHAYWGTMQQGTGVQYPLPDGSEQPTIWKYTKCMEVNGQFFYSGVPFELKARDYAAETLTAALPRMGPVTAADVIAVSAMEGVGVAEALLKYHALDSTRRRVPYTNVRTNSNWLHMPLTKGTDGSWHTLAEVPEDFVNGYAFSIATGSVTILTLFRERCLAQQAGAPVGADAVGDGSGSGTDNSRCSFHVDYDSAVQRAAGAASALARALASGTMDQVGSGGGSGGGSMQSGSTGTAGSAAAAAAMQGLQQGQQQQQQQGQRGQQGQRQQQQWQEARRLHRLKQ